MERDELYNKLQQSAEDVKVPEELQPEAIKKVLEAEAAKEQQEGKYQEPMPSNVIAMGTAQKRKWKPAYSGIVAAAMAAILLVPAVVQPMLNKRDNTASAWTDPEPAIQEPIPEPTMTASVGDFGDTLRHPDSYEEIYTSAREYAQRYYVMVDEYDIAATEDSGGGLFDAFTNSKGASVAEDSAPSYEEATVAAESEDYSKTNTREADVAEGDITITDGTNIYHYDSYEDSVEILGTHGGKLTEEAVLDLREQDGIDNIEDMYVVGDQLVIIADTYRYRMDREGNKIGRLDYGYGLEAMVYDISDASKPKMQGSTTYDGSYYSSRIYDGTLYVFTQQHQDYYYYEDMDRLYKEESFKESGIVPYINDEVAELDHIFLPEVYTGEPSFTMSSVDLKKPSKVLDYQVIMGYTSDIYVSNDAVYLETVNYTDDVNYTGIVRMNYEDGKFQPAGVGLARGDLLDDFAIDEDADGNLRVATTVVSYSGGIDRKNRLTIFDSEMKEIGKLTGLARGEEIKSARYIGDYCYLVTFENTDPLFTIDCSDPTNPNLVGELEMPGFSDYLHPWGEDKLMGFGYNGDEYGRTEGLKLAMFDISDPSDVEIIDERSIRSADESYALSNYKALLVSPEHGLVGFATRDWDEYDVQYQLYEYTEDGFELLFASDVDDYDVSTVRGLFIGDVFYLVEDGRATSYDMTNHFKKISELTW